MRAPTHSERGIEWIDSPEKQVVAPPPAATTSRGKPSNRDPTKEGTGDHVVVEVVVHVDSLVVEAPQFTRCRSFRYTKQTPLHSLK